MDRAWPEMQGFFVTDPNAHRADPPIYLSDIIHALQAVTHQLNTCGDLQPYTPGMDPEAAQTLSGLCSAANILANLIAQRQTGEDVVLKPGQRKPRQTKKTPLASDNVVPLRDKAEI